MNKYTQRGAVAELLFAAKAVEKGFNVSLPVSHDSRYDALLDNGKKIFRCQVKRIYEEELKWYKRKDKEKTNPGFYKLLTVELRRRTPGNKSQNNKYSENDFDYLIAYRVETNDVWIVPMEIVMKAKSGIHFTGRSEAARYKNIWPV